MRLLLVLLLILCGCKRLELPPPAPEPAVEEPKPEPAPLPAPAPAPPVRLIPLVDQKLIDYKEGSGMTKPTASLPKNSKKTSAQPQAVPGYDQIRYTDLKNMYVGIPFKFHVDIADPATVAKLEDPKAPSQIQNLPKSSYYLIGLEGEYSGNFEIKPTPGQEQKQHRAKAGEAAHWEYEVTALKKGKYRLQYTLRVFAENDTAGTVVQIQPIDIEVTRVFPKSYIFSFTRLVKEYGGWAALFGVLSAGIKWLMDRKKKED